MSDPTPYPRFPSEDDVPEGWGRAPEPPSGAPASPVPAAASASLGTPEPLGVLTALTTGFAALYAALMLPRYWLARDAEDQWTSGAAAGRSPEEFFTPYEVVDLVGYLVLLGAFVVTCLWLWRARRNVELLSPTSPHARSRGWVWGGWLVPVVSLWFPFQVVRDVLRVRSHHPSSGSRVGWWWGAFIVANVATGVESLLVPTDLESTGVGDLPAFAAVSTVAWVVASVVWIRVVRAVAADQEELLAGRG
ncbi:DUF4328 domain-containing protein [Aeromicrobium sp.]|uniref:DUF4328 domain-containing protein n=1 Tax=Aeromicrobium sp. TaxID=1871063 RepID=UPI0035125BCD